jgi:hypothetical protein
MKRWWTVVAAVTATGLVLAWFGWSWSTAQPKPTGRPHPPRADYPLEAPQRPSAAVAAGADPNHKPVAGSVPAQLADPNTPPDVRAAASVSSHWKLIARRVRFSDPPPAWAALDVEVNTLSEKILVFRQDQTEMDWATLVAEQQALVPRVRAADPDPDMSAALDAIEAALGTTSSQ